MKLTPLDIRKQEFKKAMRGYDPDEVEAFLGMIADEMEMLIREKTHLNDEGIKLRTQLKDYQQVEQTLRETLMSAQNTVEESRVNSRREAEIIIHEAELQAENIIKEAREELLALRHEVSLVKAQKVSFAKRLRHLLQSQIDLLQVLEEDDHYPAQGNSKNRQAVSSDAKKSSSQMSIEDQFQYSDSEPKIIRGQQTFDEPASPKQNKPKPETNQEGEDENLDDQFIF